MDRYNMERLKEITPCCWLNVVFTKGTVLSAAFGKPFRAGFHTISLTGDLQQSD
jgi:hypothetical protein